MIENENYEKSNFIMNNFKFIKKFPDEIKKININSLKENDNLEKLNKGNIITINNLQDTLLIYNENNKVYLLDNDFEIFQEIIPPNNDNLITFGYNFLFINNYLTIIGVSKDNLIFYMYKKTSLNKYELHNKVILQEIKENFYPKFINNQLFIIQYINGHLVFYNFKLTDINLEKGNIIKMKIQKGKIILTLTKKHIFLSDDKFLYIIDLLNFKLIEKNQINTLNIESFETPNNYLTVVAEEDLVTIYDDELNIRQKIKIENIDSIQFNDSYLVLINSKSNMITIFALDQNGIFIEFAGFQNSETITNINYYDHKIIISEDNVFKYLDLPKRIYNKQKLIGYGFKSEINESLGRYLLLNNGRLSTEKLEDSLLVGYTNNISDIIVNNTSSTSDYDFNFQHDVEDIDKLKKDYIVITDDVRKSNSKLNMNTINFIFIEEPNIELFLRGSKGSSVTITMESNVKIISWPDNGIIKLNLLNNTSIIQIQTKSDIEILGYNIRSDNKNFEFYSKIISENNDVLINDNILSNYQTFFPYIENNNISAIVNQKIKDIDIEFNLIPISTNLIKYNSIDSIDYNNLNQQFHKRYLIENNDKSIQVTDLFSNNQVMEFKTKDIKGIKKIVYVNPILLIFSKPENEIDTFIHLINSSNNKILPYVISNNKKENITEFFELNNKNLVFITNDKVKNIIYLVNFDNSYEINNLKKIIFDDDISDIKLFNNYLAIKSTKNEIIIYDIVECKSIVSFKDENIISFDLKYNFMAILLNEKEPIINIYEIKPDFQLITRKEISELSIDSKIYFGPGKLIIKDNDKTYVYNFNTNIGLIKIDTIDEKLVHYYKNLLITTNDDKYNLYKISPNVNFTDNMIDCQVRLNKIEIKNIYEDRSVEVNILLKVNSNSQIKIANEKIINFDKKCKNICIAKIVLKLKNTEMITIESIDQNTNFCGIIVGEFKDKLPCFLPGTLVDTPKGKIAIENLKDNDTIYNDSGEEIIIEKIHSWTTTNFVEGTIPYVIPKDSLEQNYPIEDLFVSPYHKIRLPNGDFVRACNINLPFVKQFKNNGGILKYNTKELNEIIYYNFILPNNSNFIANGIPVESLDKSNHLIN